MVTIKTGIGVMSAASIIKFTESSALNELDDAIKNTVKEGAKSILLLTCTNNGYNEEKINTILANCPLQICGGIFPKIIYKGKNYSQGAIVLGLMIRPKIVNYCMLADSDIELKKHIDSKSKQIENYQNFIIISDALCNSSEDFTDHFYDYIGSGVTTIGGGAGSMDYLSHPVIFTNKGLIGGVTQVIALPCPIKNSIGHGWEILDGPYLVTASEGHYVHSLDYKPSFDMYREIIQSKTPTALPENFFLKLAKNFPLGIMTLDGEILVRDPIQTDGSYLECVGNVPVNSMVYLLQSDQDKMIIASQKIAQQVAAEEQLNTLLLFDCISRDLFMGDNICDELEAIQQPFPNTCLVGAMALGEIANTACGSIRLLNKSTVLGSF